MKIILSAVEPQLGDAWERFCGHFDCVTIHRGSILDLDTDAVVSPANSFGFMDGGIDLLYSRFFGWEVQDRLQQLIRERHHGELIVGTAEIVDTDNSRIPFVIAAPTMRVPMILGESVNPYLAARAVFLLIKYGSFPSGTFTGDQIGTVVNTVAIPGLATGVGRISPLICARQVAAAIEDVVLQKRAYPSTWREAQVRHQRLYTDEIRDLQR